MFVINPYRFDEAEESSVLYRINCGGPELTTDGFGNPIPSTEPTWEEDSSSNPSQFLVVESGSPTNVITFTSTSYAKDSSVPGYVPLDLFKSQRYQSGSGSQTPLRVYYKFPDTGTIPNGSYKINLFFSFDYWNGWVGFTRDMDVEIEGTKVLDYTETAEATYICSMETFTVTITDGVLDLEFIKGTVQNPKIHGIEILAN